MKKKRIQQENRKEFLKKIKRVLNSSNFDIQRFIDTSDYADLKPYLDTNLSNLLEHSDKNLNIQLEGRGGGVNNFKPKLLDKLTELEIKWKLK